MAKQRLQRLPLQWLRTGAWLVGLWLISLTAVAADPTRPPQWSVGSETVVRSELVLQQVIWRSDAPLAVINQQVLAPGDSVDGATLQHIGRTHVVVVQNGQSRRLDLLATTKIKVQ